MRKHIFMRLHQNRKTRYICGAQKVEDFSNEFSSSKNDQKTIKKSSKNDQKIIKKSSKNHQKIIKKSSKNDQKIIKKSSKNDQKTIKKRSKNDQKTIKKSSINHQKIIKNHQKIIKKFRGFFLPICNSGFAQSHNFNIFTNNIIHQNNIISPPQQKNETTCSIS